MKNKDNYVPKTIFKMSFPIFHLLVPNDDFLEDALLNQVPLIKESKI